MSNPDLARAFATPGIGHNQPTQSAVSSVSVREPVKTPMMSDRMVGGFDGQGIGITASGRYIERQSTSIVPAPRPGPFTN